MELKKMPPTLTKNEKPLRNFGRDVLLVEDNQVNQLVTKKYLTPDRLKH